MGYRGGINGMGNEESEEEGDTEGDGWTRDNEEEEGYDTERKVVGG